MTTHPRAGRPASVRLSGLWTFLGSTTLAVVVAFFLSWMESAGGRAKLVALALPFVGMVWGLLQMITGRQIADLEAWFARIPVLARVPLGCLGGAALLLACAAFVAVIWRLVSGLAPAPENVWIYVDNGGERPVTAMVDAGTPMTVGPGTAGLLKTTAGAHAVSVRDGSTVVYEGQKTFAARAEVRKYVLNPDRSRRYVVETIRYGGSAPSLSLHQGPEYAANRALERISLRAPDPWVTGQFDEVFDERPPDTLPQKRGEVGAKVHLRLCRITAADYAVVAKAAEAVRTRQGQPFLPTTDEADAINRVRAACPR